MSQEDKLVRIRQKSDTAEGWLTNNPILLYGELGLEIDTQLIKIGDGVTPWGGLPYVLKDQITNLTEQVDNKANKDFSNVSSLTSTVKDTLGIATKNHATTNINYGPASTGNYGHVRTSGITGSGHYVQSQRASGITTNLNSTNYLYAGNHLVGFKINATGVPTTISADTGITSNTTMIYGVIKTDNYYSNGTNYSNSYGIKQTLIIPRYGLTYERYNYQGSDTFGVWDKLVNFKMPEDIVCDTLNASTISAGSIIGDTISSGTDIIANNNLKGMSSFTLMGENTSSGISAVYKSGPLTAPLYVGTIHADWDYSDWYTNKKPPRIVLQNSDESVTFSGYLTDKFSPNDYDIIISFDDTTMSRHYLEIAECGLYVKSDGTMGIGNEEAFQNSSLYHNEVNLGVNITIYYTGGGIL